MFGLPSISPGTAAVLLHILQPFLLQTLGWISLTLLHLVQFARLLQSNSCLVIRLFLAFIWGYVVVQRYVLMITARRTSLSSATGVWPKIFWLGCRVRSLIVSTSLLVKLLMSQLVALLHKSLQWAPSASREVELRDSLKRLLLRLTHGFANIDCVCLFNWNLYCVESITDIVSFKVWVNSCNFCAVVWNFCGKNSIKNKNKNFYVKILWKIY